MTLTISLIADGLIVQTADHRLMGSDRAPCTEDDAPKQLVATAKTWATSICFAGVAQLGHRGRASEVLHKAIEGTNVSASFIDAVNAMANGLTRWMAGATGDTRMSVTMAGFVAGEEVRLTQVALVSNWQRLSGEHNSMLLTADVPMAENRFAVSDAIVTTPVTLVSGWCPAVRDDERIRLTRLVRQKRTLEQLARAMAYINRAASERKEAKETISPACTSVAVVVGPTQINGRSLAHVDEAEREVVVPKAWCGFDLRGYMAKVVAEVWRNEGLPGAPQTLPSSTFTPGRTGANGGSPYANPDDRFFV
jgi:hypothetical protein